MSSNILEHILKAHLYVAEDGGPGGCIQSPHPATLTLLVVCHESLFPIPEFLLENIVLKTLLLTMKTTTTHTHFELMEPWKLWLYKYVTSYSPHKLFPAPPPTGI